MVGTCNIYQQLRHQDKVSLPPISFLKKKAVLESCPKELHSNFGKIPVENFLSIKSEASKYSALFSIKLVTSIKCITVLFVFIKLAFVESRTYVLLFSLGIFLLIDKRAILNLVPGLMMLMELL